MLRGPSSKKTTILLNMHGAEANRKSSSTRHASKNLRMVRRKAKSTSLKSLNALVGHEVVAPELADLREGHRDQQQGPREEEGGGQGAEAAAPRDARRCGRRVLGLYYIMNVHAYMHISLSLSIYIYMYICIYIYICTYITTISWPWTASR